MAKKDHLSGDNPCTAAASALEPFRVIHDICTKEQCMYACVLITNSVFHHHEVGLVTNHSE